MNSKKTTQLDQSAEEESKALKLALERLSKLSQSGWAKNIGANEGELIAKLFNLLATFISNVDKKNAEVISKPIPNLLSQIEFWLQDKDVALKASEDLKKRLIEELVKLEKIALEAKAAPIKSKPKNTNESSGSNDSSTNKSITKLNNELVQINESLLSIRSNTADLSNLANVNFPALVATHRTLENLISTIPQAITNEFFIQTNSMRSDQADALNKIDQLTEKIVKIQESLSSRIHIRDSVEILEIRQDVERFVSADLIKKISLAVMPALEAVKEAQPTEVAKAVQDLNTRCINTGLIPVEKLFL